MTIHDGTIQLTLTGNQSKGLKSVQAMTINGGSITASNSGGVGLVSSGSGNDPSYAKILSSDSDIIINGGTLVLTTTGVSGKPISVTGNFVMNDGSIQATCSGNGATYTNTSGTADSHHSTCLKVDGNLSLLGGDLVLTNSGSGGKGIDVDGTITIGNATTGPVIDLTTTGNAITISSGNYDEAKTMKAEGIITINNGTLTVESSDDGIKSANAVIINNGSVLITEANEGIEAKYITVNGGDISIVADDDGLNATSGTGSMSSDGSILTVNGGYVTINAASGDPLDSNGNLSVTGGTIVVHGPQSSPEVGMDYNGTGLISGGFVVISGTNSPMTQGFGSSSTQRSFILKSNTSTAANTIFHVEDASGNELFSFKPMRSYYSIVFSSPSITQGTTYKIYTSGTHTGTATDGLYSGGTYTPGTLETSFTVSGMVTTVNY